MNTPEEHYRTFLAIAPPPSVQEALDRLQQNLKRRMGERGVKWVKPDYIHLTLRFFGNVPAGDISAVESVIRPVCAAQPSLRLGVEQCGCFPHFDYPKVLWVGLSGALEDLQTFQRQLRAATQRFGDHPDDKEFHPHLTLGRIKASPREARQLGESLRTISVAALGSWTVEQVELMRSQLAAAGPTYTCMATVPLARGAC